MSAKTFLGIFIYEQELAHELKNGYRPYAEFHQVQFLVLPKQFPIVRFQYAAMYYFACYDTHQRLQGYVGITEKGVWKWSTSMPEKPSSGFGYSLFHLGLYELQGLPGKFAHTLDVKFTTYWPLLGSDHSMEEKVWGDFCLYDHQHIVLRIYKSGQPILITYGAQGFGKI